MFAATLGLSLLVAATTPPDGAWRLESQDTKVRVLSWGLFCGAEPKSSRGIPGAVYQLKNQGPDFSLSGAGKTLTTGGCSLDPAVFKLRQKNRNGDTLTVECEAPPVAGTPVVSQHRFEILSPTEIRYVTSGEKRKSEGLDNCRYAYELAMVFKANSEAGPCAQPGPPAKLVVDPAARDAKPAERICFKLQAVDAKGCAVSAGDTQFALEPANTGSVDKQGCLWVSRSLDTNQVLAVTATQGGVSGHAVVRVLVPGQAAAKESIAESVAKSSNQNIRSLVSAVAAGDVVLKTPMEQTDEDAAAPPPPPPVPLWREYLLYIGVAGGLGMVLVGILLAFILRKQTKTAQRSLTPPVPLQAVEAPEVKPPPPGVGYRCPKCGFQYARPGTCAHDGSTLELNENQTRSTLFIPITGGMVCLTCGRRYPRKAKFCGVDRTPLVPEIPGMDLPKDPDKQG